MINALCSHVSGTPKTKTRQKENIEIEDQAPEPASLHEAAGVGFSVVKTRTQLTSIPASSPIAILGSNAPG